MHQSSFDKMRFFAEEYIGNRCQQSILDVGSQDINGSYRPIFSKDGWRYIGADMSIGDNVDVVLSNPYRWNELKSSQFDVVVTGQAFEHIPYFWIVALEIYRVLKPGGLCCVIAPSAGPQHRYPVDCWRFYPDGMLAIASFAQLEALYIDTQWAPQGYDDGSDIWCDTLMVSRKPVRSFIDTFKYDIKNRMQHLIISRGL